MLRHFQELLKIKEHAIPSRGTALDWRKSESNRPSFGGVYAFWWNGGALELYHKLQNRALYFRGPKEALRWDIRPDDLLVASNGRLPLYVGKAAKDIAQRVGLHLKLKTRRTIAVSSVRGVCCRMTTSCQVRDRLDRLFPKEDTARLALDNLMLSYVRLDGSPRAFVERFYLEDYAVGVLHPMFNVDSER
jgi:hypothetical protein